ncbi:MAG: 50S ribosomal protein L23 [Raineya sp.]|nr:50S ribosomal protein L23 [Raineya sp.]MDW8295808.1 50S ribosomal protein L23 [Raineya sp.]
MKTILKEAVISEKASKLQDKGIYTFIVDKNANKVEIKNEIERLYGVTVESVNTARYAGKPKVRYTKTNVMAGKTKAYKKAVVRLAEGDFIDIYGNV